MGIADAHAGEHAAKVAPRARIGDVHDLVRGMPHVDMASSSAVVATAPVGGAAQPPAWPDGSRRFLTRSGETAHSPAVTQVLTRSGDPSLYHALAGVVLALHEAHQHFGDDRYR